MIELARFRDPHPARLLQQVLAAEGIAAQVRTLNDEALLLIEQPEQFAQARSLLDAFLADPNAARFQHHAWQMSEPLASNGAAPPMFTGQWWRTLGPVVKVVFVACVAIFLTPWFIGPQVYDALMFAPSLSALASEPWRLFGPALLHLSVLHIVFNMLWWLDLGRVIERFQSSFQLLWVTLASAAISNVAQFLDTGPNFGGLSGVVYALLGYLWLYGKVNPAAGYGLRREIVIMMLAWLVICMTGLVGPVANTAHVAGLLSGCLFGALTGWWRRQLA